MTDSTAQSVSIDQSSLHETDNQSNNLPNNQTSNQINNQSGHQTISQSNDEAVGNQTVSQTINQTGKLPQVLIDWLLVHNLSPSIYEAAHSLPRYIRLNPRININLKEIQQDLIDCSINSSVDESPIKDCFTLSSTAMISNARLYKSGAYYGIDLASMIAARSLMANPVAVDQSNNQSNSPIKQTMHVLDLCCAPGAKLCLLYDLISSQFSQSNNRSNNQSNIDWSVTGVDCSLDRLSITRNMATKYGVKARFFCGDGRTFNVPPPSVEPIVNPKHNQSAFITNVIQKLTAEGSVAETHMTKKQKRVARRTNPSTNKRQKTDASPYIPSELDSVEDVVAPESAPRPPTIDDSQPCVESIIQTNNQSINQPISRYDRVLVDAECTHDGSVKHILKFEQWGWETFERRFLNAERLTALQSIQRDLLNQGWKWLAEGGELIYSTCSFLTEQNEDIVEWFLLKHGTTIEMLPVFEGDVVTEHHEVTEQPINQSINQTKTRVCWRRGLPFKSPELQSIVQESVRLDPATSGTSGLFIAKFQKLVTK